MQKKDIELFLRYGANGA